MTVTFCGRRQMLRLLASDFPPPETGRTSLLATSALTLLCAAPGHVQCDRAVFVASRPEELPLSFSGNRCAAVLDSSNAALRAAAARLRLPALTCGLSGADTLTVSSWCGDSAVISLLRHLTAFDGSPVEPFELPVLFDTPPEPFDLLACAAVCCLLGEQNPLAGLEAWTLPPL